MSHPRTPDQKEDEVRRIARQLWPEAAFSGARIVDLLFPGRLCLGCGETARIWVEIPNSRKPKSARG
jgi:hypothetical protein